MKIPPPKPKSEMTIGEIRAIERKEEAERKEWDKKEAKRRMAITRMTEIQNSLVAEAERDIRIVKSKIDDKKENYRDYDRTYDFANDLEKLYGELATAEHKLQMIRVYPFNAPITTDTSNRNHDWYSEAYHKATSQYENLSDHLETYKEITTTDNYKDLSEDKTYGNNQTDGW